MSENKDIVSHWNPILEIVLGVKQKYLKKFNNKDGIYDFKSMINKLDIEEYNVFFECLQINQSKEFILIRYGIAEMQHSMWTDKDSPYREARSVAIDLKNESLVTCGFRKFFNLNEVKETMLDNVLEDIKKAKVFEVADKMDGSMQNARWYDNEVFMTGSMALEESESWRLSDGKKLLTEDYRNMMKNNDEITFTFEYVSDKNPHVIEYSPSDEGLYLIGARNVDTGHQLSYKELQKVAKQYNDVKIVKMENKSLEELLELTKTLPAKEKEGWVLNIDGHLIKIKCDDYVNIHRILDKVASVNVVIEAIADDYYDDLLSKVPENYRDRVERISEKLFDYTTTTNHLIEKYYSLAPKYNRKDFMIWVSVNVPKSIQGYVRCRYLNQKYNLLKNGKNGYKKMNQIEAEVLLNESRGNKRESRTQNT